MGWCTHPKRRIGSEVRIYVRGNELPCRNDWANDLWQMSDAVNTDVVLNAVASPVPPATEDELGFLAALANRPKPDVTAVDAAERGEDVVVGEMTAMSSADTAPVLEENRRLRRAHIELRAQKREQRSNVSPLLDVSSPLPVTESGMWLAGDLTGPAAGAEGEVAVANRESSESGQHIGEVSPVALGEMGRPFPKMTTFPEDDARFSSIPVPVDGFDLPLAGKREQKRVVHRAGFEDDQELTAWDSQPHAAVETESAPVPTTPELDPVSFDSEIHNTVQPARRRFIGRQRPKPVPVAEEFLGEFLDQPDRMNYGDNTRADENALNGQAHASDLQPHESREVEWSSERERLVTQARIVIEDRDERFAFSGSMPRDGRSRPEAHALETPARPQRIRNRNHSTDYAQDTEANLASTLRDELTSVPDDYLVTPMPLEDEVESAEPAHWGTVPRMCRTCRDFRPAENGERGWCTNKWAFSHRRMVDADELPCETSIGGWWLPHDDLWMSAVDVTAHSQPTPLLDQWLAQRAAANGEIDVAPPIRRRQR